MVKISNQKTNQKDKKIRGIDPRNVLGSEICPRCGQIIDWVGIKRINGREYYIGYHYIKNGQRLEHSLGPVDKYKHVYDLTGIKINSETRKTANLDIIKRIMNDIANDGSLNEFHIRKLLDSLIEIAKSEEEREKLASLFEEYAKMLRERK